MCLFQKGVASKKLRLDPIYHAPPSPVLFDGLDVPLPVPAAISEISAPAAAAPEGSGQYCAFVQNDSYVEEAATNSLFFGGLDLP